MPGVFLFLGGDNLLPLSYVENCAEAIAVAGQSDAGRRQVYNVLDDDLLVLPRVLSPLPARGGAAAVAHACRTPLLKAASDAGRALPRPLAGQLPAILTPYKVAAIVEGDNLRQQKLKALGWRPTVSTEEGLQRTFTYLKERAT